MTRRAVLVRTSLLLALASFVPTATAAEGAPPRRQAPLQAGAVLITHGDTISHIGDIPPVKIKGKATVLTKVGYAYSYWGVFWLDLWTWGGTYCIYDGRVAAKVSPAEAAQLLGIPESDLSRPFNYKYPIGLIVIVGIIALVILAAVFAPQQTNPAAPLLKDERYLQALATYSARVAKATDPVPPDGATTSPPLEPAPDPTVAAFDEAVAHLVALGVPREEAERNLALLLTASAQTNA
jgi:hypothetical protein